MRIRFIYYRICCWLVCIYSTYICCRLYDALPYFVDDLFSGVILCKFLMFRRLDASGRTGYLYIYEYVPLLYTYYICLGMPKWKMINFDRNFRIVYIFSSPKALYKYLVRPEGNVLLMFLRVALYGKWCRLFEFFGVDLKWVI